MGKGINHIKSLTEDFSYLDFNSGTNILNRLRSSAVNSSTSMIAHYAPNGNILAKSNAGDYLYKYSSAKPHAVEVVTNPDGTISNVTQNIYYSPFNKVDSIKENNYKLTYTYGPDQQRRKSILTTNNLLLTTIYYSGNYEKLEIGGNIYEVHYITSPAGLIAINVRHNNTDQLYYVYTDHLGSILTLTDDAGNKVYEQNFDAWGRERNPSDWTYTASTYTKPEWLIRGYTGHEHLDEFALINMNGRCYDPVLGRMLSPDNYVQGATGTQAFNRYSYAGNNPLKYVDPTGQSFSNPRGEGFLIDFLESIIDVASIPGKVLGEGTYWVNDQINRNTRTGPYFNMDYLMGRTPFPYEVSYVPSTNGGFVNQSGFFGMGAGNPIGADNMPIDMDAMNKEAMERYVARKFYSANNVIYLPPVTIEALRDNPRLVQKSWDRFLAQSGGGGNWDLNGDGRFQKNEADNWWLHGGGTGVSVNNANINWTGLKIPKGALLGSIFAINTTDAFLKLPYETAATYGGTSFKVVDASRVMVLDQLYHYQYSPNNSAENMMRNFMNWYGKPSGQGTDFMIHYYNPAIQIK